MTGGEMVESPRASRHERSTAVLVGLIGVIAAALVLVESVASQEAARAEAMAARMVSDLTTRLSVSSGPFDFYLGKSFEASLVAIQGTSRQIVALEAADPVSEAIGAAEVRASERLLAIAADMGAVPDESSPLDPFARTALASTIDDLSTLVAEQGRQRDLADAASARSTDAVLGLSLVALSGVLAGLAAVVSGGRAGNALLLLAYLAAGAGSMMAIMAAAVVLLPNGTG